MKTSENTSEKTNENSSRSISENTGDNRSLCPEIRGYEIKHAEISRWAAEAGFVLLKNDGGLLPLKKGKIALFGAGAGRTAKGGTGSGDVNERHTVSIAEGMSEAGFTVTTGEWIAEYDRLYDGARLAWRDEIWAKAENISDSIGLFMAYSGTPFMAPAGPEPFATDTDTAVFVLRRVAGEGADREPAKGDYYLSDEEEAMLSKICLLYKNVILLLNTGGIVDLSCLDRHENIKSVMLIGQPGQEAGRAVADVLSGEVSPSGRLTDTWPFNYEDIPFSSEFSHLNGNLNKDYYKEGIYVGYRYFDTFDVPVRFPFGYGLSYTEFSEKIVSFRCEDGTVCVRAEAENKGTAAGAESVLVYASCPEGKLKKEYRRLAGFAKTGILKPGEKETVEIRFPLKALASYSEEAPGWVLEKGIYGLFAGGRIDESRLFGSLEMTETVIICGTKNLSGLKEGLEELRDEKGASAEKRGKWTAEAGNLPSAVITDVRTKTVDYGAPDGSIDGDVWDFVNKLSTDRLVKLVTGDIENNQNANELGSAGVLVPGSAAQTSDCAAFEGLPAIVLADGPAGLRLTKEYYTKGGRLVPVPIEESVEAGFLARTKPRNDGYVHYQFCTAFPAGTVLAQSFDTDIVSEVGCAAGSEMEIFNVTLWLAPGMNIHKNPLCGRNFEYYSEDPVVSGLMAAAMTKGVQSRHDCGTTIKHFACNSQEDNRMGVDAVISERALREIYLKGFQIAAETAKPLALMTSYNLINGIHAANNRDLCTDILRKEWGFAGLVMTDWTTTMHGPDCTASGCIRAGNDSVMPGCQNDHDDIEKSLENGTLSPEELKTAAANLVKIIRRTR